MIITRTPFRISFFGGGTDLPDYYKEHGGAVLSTTIDKYLYITCRHMPPYWDFKNRFVYGSKTEQVETIEEIEHPAIRETFRFLNVDYGVDLHYNTDIPARSGMGSSSAFSVGLLNAMYGLNGKMISKKRLAMEAIHIEQDLIGEAVGSQDQTAVAFGGLNYIAFKKDANIEVKPMTVGEKRIRLLNEHLVLMFTGFQRFAVDIEKEKIRKIKVNADKLYKMKKYTEQAVEVLNSNADILQFGELLHNNWVVKKSLSEKISTDTIEEMYEIARKNGAIGGKVLGAGGGGFMLFFVRPEQREDLIKSMHKYVYVPFNFDTTGSQVIYYKEGI